MRPSHHLIENPLHDYAVEFMKRIRDRSGLTPVCVFTDARRRYYHERRFPILAELAPRTRFDATPDELPALAARLRAELGPMAGIVPFREESLDNAPRLVELFGVDWNPSEVLARFRDKHAFKAHLARRAPGLRLNRHFRVRAPADLEGELPEKFVLKPAAGGGSHGVGVFRRETPKAELARFLAAHPGLDFILEEFVSGVLYAVDGLVDERGETKVVSVFTSGRRSANGSDVVYADGWLIHQNTALFRDLAAYAGSVMAASGLRRSPFHMEVAVDEGGPCLIEVGARLVGHDHARTCALAHRNRFDFFAAAAHGYVSPEPYGDLGFDWDYYNSVQMLKVYGTTSKSGLLVGGRGVESVETMPQFRRWIVKPKAGQTLVPTTNLTNVPYSLILLGLGSLEELRAAGEAVHRTLTLETGGGWLTRLRLRLPHKLRRGLLWLGWRAAQALRSISSR